MTADPLALVRGGTVYVPAATTAERRRELEARGCVVIVSAWVTVEVWTA